ncbi:MAG: YigZ family protein [Muribaculaceae bacterium]|jgi:uncharacterized YigZ family protein|nr:YigZ family protein [Muribaculaceae bacterium]MBR4887472.1 YigZ family protein [Muribaculaceae bacterium]MEE1365257.1 YigZ family protein [Muribaculaceae bacterium]
MSDIFYTIESTSEAIYREKMSRFLAFAVPVKSADEARQVIKDYQNKFHDARHVCWAYMIGPQRLEFQLNDNGEPSGTAGKPILGQINSFNLTDIVIIVVRYFGGIKLGTSGLIVAYREAAKMAIEEASIVECHDMAQISFTFPYMSMNDVMKIGKSGDVRIVEQQFDNSCSMTIEMRRDFFDSIRQRLLSIDGVTLVD